MMTALRLGAWMLLFVLGFGTHEAKKQDPNYIEPGFQKNHEYSSLVLFDSVDLGTGTAVLTFTDLVIPGNRQLGGVRWAG